MKQVPLSMPQALDPPARIWTDAEWELISRGHTSRDMDDKWDIVVDGHWVHFHRSWTGHGIYDLRFSRVDGGWQIVEARVCGDRSWYRRDLTDEQEREQIERLITYLLTERRLGP